MANWYQNGKCHRDGDMPAVIHSDGSQEWYRNGELHRGGDQPAIVRNYGSQEWYQNGKLHRDGDLPAGLMVHNFGITTVNYTGIVIYRLL